MDLSDNVLSPCRFIRFLDNHNYVLHTQTHTHTQLMMLVGHSHTEKVNELQFKCNPANYWRCSKYLQHINDHIFQGGKYLIWEGSKGQWSYKDSPMLMLVTSNNWSILNKVINSAVVNQKCQSYFALKCV